MSARKAPQGAQEPRTAPDTASAPITAPGPVEATRDAREEAPLDPAIRAIIREAVREAMDRVLAEHGIVAAEHPELVR